MPAVRARRHQGGIGTELGKQRVEVFDLLSRPPPPDRAAGHPGPGELDVADGDVAVRIGPVDDRQVRCLRLLRTAHRHQETAARGFVGRLDDKQPAEERRGRGHHHLEAPEVKAQAHRVQPWHQLVGDHRARQVRAQAEHELVGRYSLPVLPAGGQRDRRRRAGRHRDGEFHLELAGQGQRQVREAGTHLERLQVDVEPESGHAQRDPAAERELGLQDQTQHPVRAEVPVRLVQGRPGQADPRDRQRPDLEVRELQPGQVRRGERWWPGHSPRHGGTAREPPVHVKRPALDAFAATGEIPVKGGPPRVRSAGERADPAVQQLHLRSAEAGSEPGQADPVQQEVGQLREPVPDERQLREPGAEALDAQQRDLAPAIGAGQRGQADQHEAQPGQLADQLEVTRAQVEPQAQRRQLGIEQVGQRWRREAEQPEQVRQPLEIHAPVPPAGQQPVHAAVPEGPATRAGPGPRAPRRPAPHRPATGRASAAAE